MWFNLPSHVYSHSTVNMSFVECKGIVQYELMIIICDLKIQKSSTICHTSSQANKILVLRKIIQFNVIIYLFYHPLQLQ